MFIRLPALSSTNVAAPLAMLALAVAIAAAGCGGDDGEAESDAGSAMDAPAAADASDAPDLDASGNRVLDAAPSTDPDAAPSTDPDVPNNAYCAEVAVWNESFKALEAEVIALANQRRGAGADCGDEGVFGPAPPVSADPALRCAARKHSKDMVERDFFNHIDPDNVGPGARITEAGYSWRSWGENISGGRASASATVDGWMSSDGHCANIMNAGLQHMGVGYQPGNNHRWTMVLATPR